MSCGLVSFTVDGIEPKKLADELWERHRIYIRNVTHPEIDWDVNRASLHIMVRERQARDFVEAVRELA
jgi:selenocysteine lyase/cysteine desulfurase